MVVTSENQTFSVNRNSGAPPARVLAGNTYRRVLREGGRILIADSMIGEVEDAPSSNVGLVFDISNHRDSFLVVADRGIAYQAQRDISGLPQFFFLGADRTAPVDADAGDSYEIRYPESTVQIPKDQVSLISNEKITELSRSARAILHPALVELNHLFARFPQTEPPNPGVIEDPFDPPSAQPKFEVSNDPFAPPPSGRAQVSAINDPFAPPGQMSSYLDELQDELLKFEDTLKREWNSFVAGLSPAERLAVKGNEAHATKALDRNLSLARHRIRSLRPAATKDRQTAEVQQVQDQAQLRFQLGDLTGDEMAAILKGQRYPAVEHVFGRKPDWSLENQRVYLGDMLITYTGLTWRDAARNPNTGQKESFTLGISPRDGSLINWTTPSRGSISAF